MCTHQSLDRDLQLFHLDVPVCVPRAEVCNRFGIHEYDPARAECGWQCIHIAVRVRPAFIHGCSVGRSSQDVANTEEPARRRGAGKLRGVRTSAEDLEELREPKNGEEREKKIGRRDEIAKGVKGVAHAGHDAVGELFCFVCNHACLYMHAVF